MRLDCRVCKGKNLTKVLNLGETPLANSFLKRYQLHDQETKHPLHLYFCNDCTFVQLGEVVSPELLFRDYLYVSSTSPVFVKHFDDFAGEVCSQYGLKQGDLVVDIGSNDGILLKPFKERGMKVLGIDPAVDIAHKARDSDLLTLPMFFNSKTASEIVKNYGRAKIITATSVFSHVDDLDDFIEGVKMLLADGGRFIIEVYHLGSIIQNRYFDMIYHEHLSYFSIRTITHLLERHGLKVEHAQVVNTHGGSLRVTARRAESETELKREGPVQEGYGLDKIETYRNFARSINDVGNTLLLLLKNLKKEGYKIAGYGAPAKSTTLLNYFNIDFSILDCVYDDSPLKQGLFTPGTHIKILNPDKEWTHPDYILILAWNFAEPIMKKLRDKGYRGKFIVPLPEPRVVE